MSHCVVPKQYPYLPEDGSLVWTCHPVPPPWNFQFRFTLHLKKNGCSEPKDHPCGGYRCFLKLQNREKNTQYFQSPPFFLFISPCHSFDTWNIIFPEETLNKGKGNPLSIDDSARIVCSQTPVPHQMPRGPDCFSDRQLKNWFDLQFLSQPLIFIW